MFDKYTIMSETKRSKRIVRTPDKLKDYVRFSDMRKDIIIEQSSPTSDHCGIRGSDRGDHQLYLLFKQHPSRQPVRHDRELGSSLWVTVRK